VIQRNEGSVNNLKVTVGFSRRHKPQQDGQKLTTPRDIRIEFITKELFAKLSISFYFISDKKSKFDSIYLNLCIVYH